MLGGGQLRALPAPTVLRLVPPQGTSDFCMAPDKFIMNQTESEISAGKDWPWGTPLLPRTSLASQGGCAPC